MPRGRLSHQHSLACERPRWRHDHAPSCLETGHERFASRKNQRFLGAAPAPHVLRHLHSGAARLEVASAGSACYSDLGGDERLCTAIESLLRLPNGAAGHASNPRPYSRGCDQNRSAYRVRRIGWSACPSPRPPELRPLGFAALTIPDRTDPSTFPPSLSAAGIDAQVAVRVTLSAE